MGVVLANIEDRIRRYNPEADWDLLRRAYRFSEVAHHGQMRASGRQFIEHPLAVAYILANLELDPTTIAAALLHDCVEDTDVTLLDIQKEFGDEITLLVDGVTKLGMLEGRTPEETQVENLRKMFLAVAQDIRVLLIRLADRLHNMRTLGAMPKEKRREVARETLDVFAPLAGRLGIFRIKMELEDLSLRYSMPDKYRELVRLVAKKREEREDYTQIVIDVLTRSLEEAGISADIGGRAKHFYSIYRKMFEQNLDFSEVYDLVAFRVITDSIKDCYAALGIVHTLWKPIPGRFKDYIAMPKSNMYQSLHTTVVGPEGEPFEIQIRTWDMHRTAEFGIAAHWLYKEGGNYEEEIDDKVGWLRQLMAWLQDLKDAREFMETLRIDLFADEVFVFTPKGDVVDLPAGACPIDFAYRIHTDVGHRCIGAKVNARIVPLNYNLKNGDIVEILTSKTSGGPSIDWLDLVVTSGAKSRIRQWFKRQRREENIDKGREMLERELRRIRLPVQEALIPEYMDKLQAVYNVKSEEDLMATIGYGGIKVTSVAGKLKDLYEQDHEAGFDLASLVKPDRLPRRSGTGLGVEVKGVDNLLIRFAKCCNPVPGDEIEGYITRGRGVSIHRADCPNIRNAGEESRLVEVDWDNTSTTTYPVDIEITGLDRPGLLSDVANAISDTRTNIISADARGGKGRTARITLTLGLRSLEHFEYISRKITKIKDVFTVSRIHEGYEGH